MEARAYDLKWLHLPNIYLFKSSPSVPLCARSVTLMYVFGFLFLFFIFSVCSKVRESPEKAPL